MVDINLMVVAGEPSGDIHAAGVIKKLKKHANLRIFGTGGVKLHEQGQIQIMQVRQMEVIGFDGVIEKIPSLLKLSAKLLDTIKENKIHMVLLVDYPGFNLRFAEKVKKNFPNVKVVGFIAPQIWVWRYSRVKQIRKYYDKLLCILPFEEKLFRRERVNAVYIGNPVTDNIKLRYKSRKDFLNHHGLDDDKILVGIIPGSRQKEVASLMPVINKAVDIKLAKQNIQFILAQADSISDDVIMPYRNNAVDFIKGETADIMRYSDILWICSGTATLEAAILGTPMVILYQTGWVNFRLITAMTKLRMVGLPNIIYEKMWGKEGVNQPIVPELLWHDCNPEKLVETSDEVLSAIMLYRSKLTQISELFRGKTPMKTAAEEIIKMFPVQEL